MRPHRQNSVELSPQTREFYCQTFKILNYDNIPFLVGGAYAFERYTGIARHTKDVDIFVHPHNVKRVLDRFAEAGYQTGLAASHWLGKAYCGDNFVDIIFCGANGYVQVDDDWFAYAVQDTVFDIPVKLCAPEEMIWSKSYVMARDRFDGADIAHLIRACGDRLDWHRLLARFGEHWRLLFSHLVAYGFIYPGERSQIPQWIMRRLCQQLEQENGLPSSSTKLCRGTLLAPWQYRTDIEQWGYEDARLHPRGNLTQADLTAWVDHLQQESGSTH